MCSPTVPGRTSVRLLIGCGIKRNPRYGDLLQQPLASQAVPILFHCLPERVAFAPLVSPTSSLCQRDRAEDVAAGAGWHIVGHVYRTCMEGGRGHNDFTFTHGGTQLPLHSADALPALHHIDYVLAQSSASLVCLPHAGRVPLPPVPSAFSGHLLGNHKRFVVRTTKVSIHPLHQLSCCQQTRGFDHGPFAMDPMRFQRIAPRTFDGQGARHKPETVALTFDLLVVLSDPLPHGLAPVPRGIVPHQQQRRFACGGQLRTGPGQKLDRHCTHGMSSHKAQPHLVLAPPLSGPFLYQHAIASQGGQVLRFLENRSGSRRGTASRRSRRGLGSLDAREIELELTTQPPNLMLFKLTKTLLPPALTHPD
jgi:hypothetical protein